MSQQMLFRPMKTTYNVKSRSPRRDHTVPMKIDFKDILLRFCHHGGEHICIECKLCKQNIILEFPITFKNDEEIKKVFIKIPHTCKKYRAPLRSGQPYTIKKRTRMRNRIKKLFRRRRRTRRS